MKKTLSFFLVLIPIALGVLLVNKVFWNQVFASPSPLRTPEPLVAAPVDYGANIQVALCLDVSSSMSGLIDQAKGKLWDIVNELSLAKVDGKPTQLEIALYIYGSPLLEAEKGYSRQLTPFTTDLDLISEELFALSTNGGDEYCGQVIDEAVRNLCWKEGEKDLRMIFIAGNEPFTQGPVNYVSSIGEAQRKSIVVNTIFCGGIVEGRKGSWENGAKIGLGEYMNIDHTGAVTHIVTPYDQQIEEYNNRLNQTYIYYGNEGKELKDRQMAQDANASSFGTGNVVKRAKTKASKTYKNEKWDLVDAAEAEDFAYDKVDKATLADSLQNLSDEELKMAIEKNSEERSRLKKEINELYKKREAYVKEKRKETDKGQLDEAMLDAIREQGEKKGMVFKQ